MKATALTCTCWYDGPLMGTLRLEDGRELCYWWDGVDTSGASWVYELWPPGYETRETYPEGETPIGTIGVDDIDFTNMAEWWK